MKKYISKLAFVVAGVGICSDTQAGIVGLGASDGFAVLGGSTVTNTGPSVLDGDLGVANGTAITGFFGTNENDGPGTFTGASHQNDPLAQMAQADALTAYDGLAAFAFAQSLSGQNLGGLTLTPGIYNFATSAELTGILTLDGAGDYVFQIGSTLTTASNSSIAFLNGADPYNDVFWQVGTSATLGTGTQFGGTIIADQSNTLDTGASVRGRVIAINGAVTLDSNSITIPEPGTAPLLAALGGVALVRRRRSVRNAS